MLVKIFEGSNDLKESLKSYMVIIPPLVYKKFDDDDPTPSTSKTTSQNTRKNAYFRPFLAPKGILNVTSG